MKVFFDTSVLVAGLVEAHPMHGRAFPWLQRAVAGELDFFVASHSLAETYAVLTTMPLRPRVSPGTAWRLVNENILTHAQIVSLSASDYRRTIKRLSESGQIGGIVYDALLSIAAEKSRVDRLLTLNPRDFQRVWPGGRGRISSP